MLTVTEVGSEKCAIEALSDTTGGTLAERKIAGAITSGMEVVMQQIAKINDDALILKVENPNAELTKRVEQHFNPNN